MSLHKFSLSRDADENALPSFLDALVAGGIFYRISGSDPASCLKNVVELLRFPEEVDREFLLQVLLARENIEPTALGNGIAMPHLRNPIVLHLPKPRIVLSFLETPVDFKALDGRPVHALFTLVSPRVKAQLHLQSRLAYALKDPGFQQLIEKQASRDEIFGAVERL